MSQEKRNMAAELQAPFPAKDIEWRVQQAGIAASGKPYAIVLAYVTNRAIMERLDEVFTPMNWENKFNDVITKSSHIIECGIGVRVNDKTTWKWDASDETQVEAVKGGRSGAMKRAGVQWGIGRYLYNLDASFAICFDNSGSGDNRLEFKSKAGKHQPIRGSWTPPKLPEWALPKVQS